MGRILTANLAGHLDGSKDDIVLLDQNNHAIYIYLADDHGNYTIAPQIIPMDFGVLEMTLVPATDGFTHIAVTNRINGDVYYLNNDGFGHFSLNEKLPAGTGLQEDNGLGGTLSHQAVSRDLSGAAAAGDFSGSGETGIAVSDPGSNSIAVLLPGSSPGDLFKAQTSQLSFSPGYIVSGNFEDTNHDGAYDSLDRSDLAALDQQRGTITVLLGQTNGTFETLKSIDLPLGTSGVWTGLTVADVTRPGGGGLDGIPDLLLGDVFGDVLVLVGVGGGKFIPLTLSGARSLSL